MRPLKSCAVVKALAFRAPGKTKVFTTVFLLLKERYGDKLCFFGGINCETLIEGPLEKAREEVRYAIQHAAPGGGLVIATGNVLQPGTSLTNYLATRQATREYGQYPIVVDRR